MTKRERCLRAKECHEKGLNCGQCVLLAFTDVTGLSESRAWRWPAASAVDCAMAARAAW